MKKKGEVSPGSGHFESSESSSVIQQDAQIHWGSQHGEQSLK